MRVHVPALLSIAFLTLAASALAQTASSPAGRFRALLDDDWKFWMSRYPESATAFGYPGHDARWTDYSPGAIEARNDHLRRTMPRLDGIERGRLDAGRPAQLRPVPRHDRDRGGGAGVRERRHAAARRHPPQPAHADQPDGGHPAGHPAPHQPHAGRHVRRLREHRRAPPGGAGAGRSDHRAHEAGARAGAHASADHASGRARAGRGADGRRPADQPAAGGVREDAGRDRRGGSRSPHEGGRRGVHGRRAAGLHTAPRVPGQGLPARLPRDDRRECAPQRGGDVRLQRALAHDDDEDAEGDSRDRPGGGDAHPRRDGRHHREGRLQRELRRLQAVPAHQSGVLLHGGRGAPVRLPGCGQARRPGARAPVRHAAANAVRDRPRAGRDGAVADHGLLRAWGARCRPSGQHVREHVQARRAAEVGDGGADAARGRARPSSADRARAGARGPSGVPQEHELHGVCRRLGALRREPRRRDGLLPGSVLEVRTAHVRHVARGPARRRHRTALDGMDAPAGDRLLRGQRREDAPGHHRRGRPLHRLAGPGGRIQDGPAEDPRAENERRAPARTGVRRSRVPRRRARAGRRAPRVARAARRRVGRVGTG